MWISLGQIEKEIDWVWLVDCIWLGFFVREGDWQWIENMESMVREINSIEGINIVGVEGLQENEQFGEKGRQ